MRFKTFLTESDGHLLGRKFEHDQLGKIDITPTWVSNFNCFGRQLTSLKGAPKVVQGVFNCSYNWLTNLEHCPIEVISFDCSHNRITSLEGAPKTNGRSMSNIYNCSYNDLINLIGGPETVNGTFSLEYNPLTSLEGAPMSVDIIDLSHTMLSSLHNIHRIIKRAMYIRITDLPRLESHVLGLLLIRDLREIDVEEMSDYDVPAWRRQVFEIINKYLPNTRGMAAVNECQDELIEADLEDFAEL